MRREYIPLLIIPFLCILSAGALAGGNSEARAAIVKVIQGQLDAFRRDDGKAAFSYASPDIQAIFGTPENFMKMVRKGYAPVYRPKLVIFLDLVQIRGIIIQRVHLVGPGNRPWIAHYPMIQMPGGEWRTGGCFLQKVKGGTT